MKAPALEPEGTGDRGPLAPGEHVGERWVVDGPLGRGASGVVYAAHARDGGSPVALKVIHAEHCHDRQIFGRYRREAAILRQIGGEHIVGILDFIEHRGLLVIVLERVAGEPLEHRLGAPLPLRSAVTIAAQIARGLASAHEAGVVHRDLKPANVMVEDLPGGEPRVRILDFGLAKVLHGEHLVTGLTERDMIFGTPEYMAPEQARGEDVDVRCDVYALGAILYEMVTGSVPLRGRTPLATMTAQLTEPVEPMRVRAPDVEVPAAVEAIVGRALEKDPSRRWPSARALADALEAATERRVISVGPPSGDDLHAQDTELSLRRSQIKRAAALLEEAERLAASKVPVPAPPRSEGEVRSWVGPLVTVVALVACIAAGIALALR